MGTVVTEITIEAPPEVVWAHLADIASHRRWMLDAESISFLGHLREGVGTRFACVTKVGPLRTTDVMEITRWEEPHVMSVSHVGVVTGEGTFTLSQRHRPGSEPATTLTWSEDLRFPIWFGSRLGETVAAPILYRVWRSNLQRFKTVAEQRPSGR